LQVVYFEGCPNLQIGLQRLNAALKATGHTGTAVDLVQVSSAE